MATTITPNSATQFETRVRNTRYAQGEVVALARLILRGFASECDCGQ